MCLVCQRVCHFTNIYLVLELPQTIQVFTQGWVICMVAVSLSSMLTCALDAVNPVH